MSRTAIDFTGLTITAKDVFHRAPVLKFKKISVTRRLWFLVAAAAFALELAGAVALRGSGPVGLLRMAGADAGAHPAAAPAPPFTTGDFAIRFPEWLQPDR